MWHYVIALNVVGLLWGVVIILGLPYTIAIAGTILITSSLAIIFVAELWRARRAARDLEAALGAQASAHSQGSRPEEQVEIDEMRRQFLEELGALKASRLGGGGAAALYSLPWYAIIGPPGAGKSTALRNSGLTFPARSDAVKGIGGTRNCDGWLTNEAVLLDTAGRYTLEWRSPRLRAGVRLELEVSGAQGSQLRVHGKGRKRSLRLALGDLAPPKEIAKGAPLCTP